MWRKGARRRAGAADACEKRAAFRFVVPRGASGAFVLNERIFAPARSHRCDESAVGLWSNRTDDCSLAVYACCWASCGSVTFVAVFSFEKLSAMRARSRSLLLRCAAMKRSPAGVRGRFVDFGVLEPPKGGRFWSCEAWRPLRFQPVGVLVALKDMARSLAEKFSS